jgi:mRNA interferase MazF
MPGNVLIRRRKAGLAKDCVANVSQIASIDRSWLTEHVGTVTRNQLAAVEEGLRLLLEL